MLFAYKDEIFKNRFFDRKFFSNRKVLSTDAKKVRPTSVVGEIFSSKLSNELKLTARVKFLFKLHLQSILFWQRRKRTLEATRIRRLMPTLWLNYRSPFCVQRGILILMHCLEYEFHQTAQCIQNKSSHGNDNRGSFGKKFFASLYWQKFL